MSEANQKQIGGSHYGGGEYQHWDWVCDTRLHYLPATASKYVDRWRKHPKGAENLEKALHYLQKAQERHVEGSLSNDRYALFWKFVIARSHLIPDALALYYVMDGNWQAATEALQALIAESSANSQSS